MCLTERQANHVYKKVEEGGIINVNTLKKELEQDLDREDDNPYKRVVLIKYIGKNTKLLKLKIGPFLLTKSNIYIMMKRLNINLN